MVKNLIYLLLVFVIGCTVPTETVLEKETIIKESGANVVTLNTVVFPEQAAAPAASPAMFAFISAQAEDDFNAGKMYVDNCFATDGEIHTLDLSSIVGTRQVFVALEFRLTGGDETEYANFKIRPYGWDVDYQTATAFFGTPKKSTLLYLVTDDQGRLEWYSEYGWPEVKAVNMEIVLRWYSVGITVQ